MEVTKKLITKIYLLSGLGADHRVFQFIDFSQYEIRHVSWEPISEAENIQTYAKKLIKQIDHPKPILIGLSFGGIIAQEIAALVEVEKLIIISSVKSRSEIPDVYKLLGKFVISLTPSFLLNQPKFLLSRLFGIQNKAHRVLFYQILKDTDKSFLRWAMFRVVKWNEPTEQKVQPIHIHGSNDYVFPLRSGVDHMVEGGGHFMIVSRAEEMNEILLKILNNEGKY